MLGKYKETIRFALLEDTSDKILNVLRFYHSNEVFHEIINKYDNDACMIKPFIESYKEYSSDFNMSFKEASFLVDEFFKSISNDFYNDYTKSLLGINKIIYKPLTKQHGDVAGYNFYYPLNNILLVILNKNNSQLPITMAHEFAHSIKYIKTNLPNNNQYYFKEADALFIELLFYDFLEEKNICASTPLHIEELEGNFIINAHLNNAIDVLNNKTKLTKDNLLYLEYYNSNVAQLISYITAINLYILYQSDKEKALWLYDFIIKNYNSKTTLSKIDNFNSSKEYFKKLMK